MTTEYYIIIFAILILCVMYHTATTDDITGIIPLSKYPEMNLLKNNYDIILRELNHILTTGLWSNYDDLHKKDIFRNNNIEYVSKQLNEDVSKVDNKTNEPKWKIFGLIFNKHIKNDNQCPKTIELLKSIPCIINAGFSCLEAGKATDVHTDDNKNYYRYQLPIIIPKGNTGFKVSDITIDYKTNEPFIFDDSYPHQAWNYTNEIRVVLICDIMHK
ncbi:MAG: hypothetical protein Gaeavirus1_26 [Gaeavirus sp.]|uniref:Aspartyl/asparaginy/proline hydroxylase domain-containing protein n=1 Tax=Gaeavirus sp. TaxID=2487767 RepID=A0A3G5A332_9VIRU|nr:MAG: hypothetical protein Gaeavirus1_26 [Gaeavirus sp.]